jgi:hypothetical protein
VRVERPDGLCRVLPCTDGFATAVLYMMEIDRVKFCLSRYLSARLRKIERHALQLAVTGTLRARMSPEEDKYHRQYLTLLVSVHILPPKIPSVGPIPLPPSSTSKGGPCGRRFVLGHPGLSEGVVCWDSQEKHMSSTALRELPPTFRSLVSTTEEERMLPEPDLDSFVFCRVKKDLGMVSPGTDTRGMIAECRPMRSRHVLVQSPTIELSWWRADIVESGHMGGRCGRLRLNVTAGGGGRRAGSVTGAGHGPRT